MNRRQMLMMPGVAAAAAGTALADIPPRRPPTTTGVSRKRVSKYGKGSEMYKVPKTAAKSAKYIAFLTGLLGLTLDQQQQISSIFASAMEAQAALRTNRKTARQSLVAAVQNGNSGLAGQIAAALGLLTAQHLAAGAGANLQFLQVLTPEQQSQLAQFHA